MLYHTGQQAPVSGSYNWDGYMDGSHSPAPTSEERVIQLSRGETFPPVKSCNKAAYWTLA